MFKKYLNKEQALKRLQNLCSKSEKSRADIEKKLYQWGVSKSDIEFVIKSLESDNFINDVRYAEIYVREKLNLNKWGRIKIKYMLIQKGIKESVINNELNKISEERYKNILEQLLIKKHKSLINIDIAKQKQKLLSYASSRGFESGKVFDIVVKIIDNKES